ncbi:phosphotransferase [Salinicoccus sp. ID82-1]|uniref:phosphotransferase family protein n=1 Tax=Salinicoccus sp. ID82-1 TaxID=2820269 RepID=UPI001F320CCD|nr:phosphotransferase [Salinicoccus sp. ID82-1]MCG1008484.1 phosphotransferase [Salinicoccus sp. ID82-1]
MNIKNHFTHLGIVSIEKLNKGWSGDEKFILTDDKGKRYLLRLVDIKKKERKIKEYELIERCDSAGVPVQKPLEHGALDDKYYILVEWIDGAEASELLPALTSQQQYDLGVEAGEYLRRIHALPNGQPESQWEEKFNRKIDSKIRMYEQCAYKYDKGHLFIEYIENHRHLLDDREQVPHHGDYHCGNMIIDDELDLHIIDFNRHDVGEPWEEFNRIVWCAGRSSRFAAGRVDGYFDGHVPDDFWKLLLLYISTNTLSSLPWGVPFGEKQIEVFMNQAKEILSWYDDMNTVVPSWYRENK